MIKFFLLIIFFLWTLTPALSQKIIKGKIIERLGKKPIAFTNIGIPHSNIGTISNEDGSFTLTIPTIYANDTLLFSALGYHKRNVPISSVDSDYSIAILLSEKVTQLKSVTVSARREKNKEFWLGNKYNRGGHIYSDSLAAGSAMALLIENKYPAYHANLTFPVFVSKALLKISVNTFDEFKVRIRFLEVDSITKLPGKDLFDESVIVTSHIKSGWLMFDLSSFNFKIDNASFFLAFEWILDDTDRLDLLQRYKEYKKDNPEKVILDTMIVRGEKVPYYNWLNFVEGTSFGVSPIQFSLDNYQCYYRNNSFGVWKRASGILTARLLVTNQPPTASKLKSDARIESTPCAERTAECQAAKQCQDFIDEGFVNGLQLTVSVKNIITLSKGFGVFDIEGDNPVTTQTRFRIGSISKALTSVALIKLVTEKKLDLDAPVQRYVPSFPQKKYPITTRQLAGHLAGVRHYSDNELIRKEHYTNSIASISIFKNDSLLFEPGRQYHYSSYGWNLIGAVVEGASGKNYLDYMFNNIWQPLGMLQTYGDVTDSIMPNKSKFYNTTGEEADGYDLSYKYPSGGLISTTEDLVRLGNELLHGNYFDRTQTKQLFETQHTSDDVPTNYGLGWMTGIDKNGHRIWYHTGHLLESSGYLLIYPDDEIVVALLANSGEGLSFDIKNIGELFYKK